MYDAVFSQMEHPYCSPHPDGSQKSHHISKIVKNIMLSDTLRWNDEAPVEEGRWGTGIAVTWMMVSTRCRSCQHTEHETTGKVP
jgi:hypothetical protein